MEVPNAPDRRIGRRKLLEPLQVGWRLPDPTHSRRRRKGDTEQTGWLMDLSVTGASIEAPHADDLVPGHRVRISFRGAEGTVVIRRVTPCSTEWTLRYGVEFTDLGPELADLLRQILEADRPADLEQRWLRAT